MKIRLSSLIIICMLFIISFSTITFAEELKWEDVYGDDTICILTPEGTTISRDEKRFNRRDEHISTAIAQIANEGKGNIGILLHTTAHHNVDSIYQVGFLDRWDSEKMNWVNVDSYEFNAYAKDYPNGLYQLVSTVTENRYPSGYYYRLRGLHTVRLNGEVEGFATRTDGVLITDP